MEVQRVNTSTADETGRANGYIQLRLTCTNTTTRSQCIIATITIHPTITRFHRTSTDNKISQCLKTIVTQTTIKIRTNSFIKTLTPTPCGPTKVIHTQVSTVTLPSMCAQPHTTTKPHNTTPSSSVSSALGALVGTLIVLLAFVTTALVWTWWKMKKRGGMKDILIRNK